jgi:hypothetical protein
MLLHVKPFKQQVYYVLQSFTRVEDSNQICHHLADVMKQSRCRKEGNITMVPIDF